MTPAAKRHRHLNPSRGPRSDMMQAALDGGTGACLHLVAIHQQWRPAAAVTNSTW